MKEQEIGKLFKEKLAGYQTPPPEGVWNGIQHDAALKKFNRSRAFHRVATRIILPIIGVVAVVSTILIIAFNNKDNIDECYEMGVNDYVAKPIIPGRIISSVETQMRNVKFAEYEPKAEQHQLKTPPASVVEMDPAKYTG